MCGYNGQIPESLIKVRQDSSIYVNFTNNLDIETTVYWHGLRLENRFDSVSVVTQELSSQETGLYGNILVEPSHHMSSSVDKEAALSLDDIKVVNGDIYPFNRDYADFTLTGRFGNII